MTAPYSTPLYPASNANRMQFAPVPAGFLPLPTHHTAPPPPQYPMMVPVHPHQQRPLYGLGYPQFPFYPLHHNLPAPPLPVRQPFFPVNPLPFVAPPQNNGPATSTHFAPAPRPPPPQAFTRHRTRMHNTSLNTSLMCDSASFNESIRYNPMGHRGAARSRDQSLLADQSANSNADRSCLSNVQPSEIANNNELIIYCANELARKSLTEQELVVKIGKSRRFRKFGVNNIPSAVSIILNTFPCFSCRTVTIRTGSNDLQPATRVLWSCDRRYERPRGSSKLNATMFEIPAARNSEGNEILSVLDDIESLNIQEENQPPKTVATMQRIMQEFSI